MSVVKTQPERASLTLTAIPLAFLLVCQTTFATSFVTLIDHKHHRIVIGADSLITGNKGHRLECKIIETRDCVFVAAGVYNLVETNFHLFDLAKTACTKPGGIQAKADEFLKIAKAPAGKAAQFLFVNNLTAYREEVANPSKGYIDVVFAGLKAFGVTEVSSRGFLVDPTGALKTLAHDQHDLPPSPDFAFFGGANTQIDAYLKTHKNVWNEMDFTNIAKRLVQLEIDGNPNDIGPPISVFEIDGHGNHTWIQRGVCGPPETRQRKQN